MVLDGQLHRSKLDLLLVLDEGTKDLEETENHFCYLFAKSILFLFFLRVEKEEKRTEKWLDLSHLTLSVSQG